MKKYWVLLIIPLALFCLLFWEFLGEVEECVKVAALCGVRFVCCHWYLS